jgi:hypothetical protein
LEVQLFPENKRGLSSVYNQAIDQFSKEPCLFVFAHDDLLILDFYWASTIANGLEHFGIVGCAGNRRRQPLQPSWPFQEVKLLDGLLLAAYSETLIKNNIRFDEQFDFHFYDLDFCRQAEMNGVTMGTIPLSLVHESGGNFGTDSWKQGYQKYLQKWKA